MWEKLKAVRWLTVIALLYGAVAFVLVLMSHTPEALVVAVVGVSLAMLANIRE